MIRGVPVALWLCKAHHSQRLMDGYGYKAVHVCAQIPVAEHCRQT